jgi:hypothetical protein
VTLVRKTSSKSFFGVCSIGLNFAILALANRMSRWPNSFLTRSKRLAPACVSRNIRFDGRRTQFIRSRGKRCRIAARNCNTSAVGDETTCRRKAGAAIPSGNKGSLPRQQHRTQPLLVIMESRVVISQISNETICHRHGGRVVGRIVGCTYPIQFGCPHRCDKSKGESIGRWYRRYFGISRRNECVHTSISSNASKSAPIPSRSTSPSGAAFSGSG